MTLEEAKRYRDQCLLEGHDSDGCTLVKDFMFTPACQIHDFLIRFKRVSRKEADSLFLQGMLELAGKRLFYKGVAYTYYFAMRYIALAFNGDFTLALGMHGFAAVVLGLYYFG